MRIVQGCIVLGLLAGLALVPRVASAQIGGPSDSLSETIVDLGTGGPVPITVPPPPAFFSFPEASEPFDTVVPLPGREIDFIEGVGPTQGHISDRLSISPYEVRVASDGNPAGLPRRTANSTFIPFSALETFQPIRIDAKSDGELTNQTQSDSLTITLGYYGPGTGTVVFSGVIPEPLPEGVTEPVLTFVIPPTSFDIEEPPIEAGGQQGIISDYVDILTQFQVRFISSDDPAVYGNLPLANGFVLENFETGGGVRYSLDFVSDAVPEPASFILLSMGLLSWGLISRRRSLH